VIESIIDYCLLIIWSEIALFIDYCDEGAGRTGGRGSKSKINPQDALWQNAKYNPPSLKLRGGRKAMADEN